MGKSEHILKFIALLSLICYTAGFLIWNTFLYALRFNDTAILEVRYVYTGFWFLLYASLFLLFIVVILKQFTYFTKIVGVDKNPSFLAGIILAVIILCSIFLYSILIFPKISRLFGGGRPQSISLLVGENAISLKYLDNFGIKPAEGSSVQTVNLCVAYDNAEAVLVLLSDRTLQLNKSKLNGVAILPIAPIHQIERSTCTSILGANLMTSFDWEQSQLTRSIFEWIYDFEVSGLGTNECKITIK